MPCAAARRRSRHSLSLIAMNRSRTGPRNTGPPTYQWPRWAKGIRCSIGIALHLALDEGSTAPVGFRSSLLAWFARFADPQPDAGGDGERRHQQRARQAPLADGLDREELQVGQIETEAKPDQRQPAGHRPAALAGPEQRWHDCGRAPQTAEGQRGP